MILRKFNINQINLDINNLILLYGKNEGLKVEFTKKLIKKEDKVFKYDEREILENPDNFFEIINSKSFFEDYKFIIIKRSSDKIVKILQEFQNKKLDDITIIVYAENLDKKSKLRILFEKDKNFVCVAFYPDDTQTLIKLTREFFNKRKIEISSENMNEIIAKCNKDRQNLQNELKKIELYCLGGQKIDSKKISKLINLAENHNITELIDQCLAKNKKKTISILNENSFSQQDCLLITRAFLNKAKKILKLTSFFDQNKNLELTISSARPPIFWKDIEITKQQILKWKPKNLKRLIFELNDLELFIKRNINNSTNIITDFILDKTLSETNN